MAGAKEPVMRRIKGDYYGWEEWRSYDGGKTWKLIAFRPLYSPTIRRPSRGRS